MSSKTLTFFPFLLLPMFFFGAFLVVVNAESVPTVNDILRGLKASESQFFQLDSFLVNCERKKSEDIMPSQYSGKYSNVAFIVAKKGEQWFTSKAFTEVGQKNSEGDNIVRGIYSPLEPDLLLFKKHLLLEWHQSSVHAIVDRFIDGHSAHGRFDYFRHIGWNMSRFLIESEGKNYDTILKDPGFDDVLNHPFLPEYLEKNKSRYIVRPTCEEVDGFPCWVVEYPGMDKLWVDTEQGDAVRKRIYHVGVGKPRKFAIHNQDWKEVAPKLWLPHRQIVDKYVSIDVESPKIWDQVTARMYYEVNKILINTVPDELFDVELPVGTHVYDIARDTRYTVYDENTDPFAGPIEFGLKANRWVKIRAICIIVGSIMIFMAFWLWLRRMEMREREGK
jgi:hypothetical protein